MIDTEKGFYFVGQPDLTPIEELKNMIVELDHCPKEIKELREHEEQIFDSKIYIKNQDHFDEVVLLKRAVKTAHVMLPCGTKQCLPGKYLDEEGKYTRHTKTMVRDFYCGWRARQYVLSKIEKTEDRYTKLKKRLIPDLVRSIRNSGGTIPKEIISILAPYYHSVK